MSVGIVGGGAVGLLLASELSKTTRVSLYIRRHEQKESLTKKGLTTLGHLPITNFTLKMTSDPWTEDLIVIAVKQPALNSLLKEHGTPVNPEQSLLFIQNGMAHLERLKDLPFSTIFVGSIEHGVRKLDDATIDWRGKGKLRCGVVKGEPANLDPLINQLSLQAELVEDWFKMLEDKLVVNAVINPLTALYRIENGEILNNPHFLKVAKGLYEEIALALNMTSDEKHRRWGNVQSIGERTATNRSSMLQDIEAGRPTEVDAILGYILNLQTKGPSLPISQLLYDSIKGLEIKGIR